MGLDLQYTQKRVTILDGQSLSDAVDIQGFAVVAIATPVTWTAAVVTGQVDPGDGVFRDLYTNGAAEAQLSGGGNRVAFFSAPNGNQIIGGIIGRAIKLRSGTTSAAVNQVGADRTLILLMQPLGGNI